MISTVPCIQQLSESGAVSISKGCNSVVQAERDTFTKTCLIQPDCCCPPVPEGLALSLVPVCLGAPGMVCCNEFAFKEST